MYYINVNSYKYCYNHSIKEKDTMNWNKPEIKEIAVGLEINCYACAEI